MSGLRGTIHDRREAESLQRLAGQRGTQASSAVLQQQAVALEGLIAASIVNLERTRVVLKAAQDELTNLQQDQGNLAGRLDAAEGDITALQGSLTALDGIVSGISDSLSALLVAAGAVVVPALDSEDLTDPPDEIDFNALRADVVALRQAVLDLQGAVS